MISLEKAKKLREAGLEWEPQIGDVFYFKTFKDWGIDAINSEDVDNNLDETKDYIDEGAWIFAPRLDQLLAEIEKQECQYILNNNFPGMPKGAGIELLVKNVPGWLGSGNSAEEVAAEALLWLYEGRVKE